MEIEILNKPSYSIAKILMNKSEEIQAETNAMVSMSSSVRLETEVKGGLIKGITRVVLGGESFFINRFVADADNCELNLAPHLPGDIETIEIDGEFYLQSGSYLASDTTIDIDVKWGGAQTFFAKEGLFLLKLKGKGKLLFSSYGGLIKRTLAEGEKHIVDNGHIIGFSKELKYEVKPIGGFKQSILSGEGFVAEFEGPGDVYIQTRNEADLLSWITPHIYKRIKS